MLKAKMKRKSLNDVIPDWLSGNGIMSALTLNYSVPWAETYLGDNVSLDIAYQGAHSGRKYITPFLEYFVDEDTEKISSSDVNKIAGALWATYRRKWDKLWELYMKEYDPFHNYDMTTEVTEGIQSTGTKGGTVSVEDTQTLNNADTTTKTGTASNSETKNDDLSIHYQDTEHLDNEHKINTQKFGTESTTYGKIETGTKTGTEALGKNTTVTTDMTTTDTGSGTTDNQLFGFNSTSAVDSDASQTTDNNTKEETGTVVTTGTDTTTFNITDKTENTGKDVGDNSLEETGTITDEATNVLTRDHAQSSITTINNLLTNNLVDETRHTGTIEKDSLTTNDLTSTDNASREMLEEKKGNIGVATVQRMFKEEVENWVWTYMTNVFSDIDAMLVLAVH